MKYCFTTLAVVLLSAVTYSQTTFPTSNAAWVNSFYEYELMNGIPIKKHLVFDNMFVALEADTAVNQQTYNKIIKNDSLYYGALREETGKVFFIPKDSLHEFLLYDFTVHKGDTLDQVYMEDPWAYAYVKEDLVVTYVDSILLEGVYRKQFFLDNDDGYWIEGVGCQYGLFVYPYNMVSYWESELTCMSIGETTTYPEFGNTPCAKVSSVGEMTKADFTVYPNPANESLFVESISLRENQQVKIFNQLGKLVLNSEHKNGSVDISILPAGLYFIELEHQEGNRVKFMKE